MNALRSGRTALGDNADHLGNHIARSSNNDGIPYPDVFAIEFVNIVKRGIADGYAANKYRL